MPDPLMAGLIGAAGAVIGALLTILLTPKLQHYFWTLQRRAELRLSVINDSNRLFAEFIANFTPTWNPDRTFMAGLISITSQVRDLFSPDSYQTFLQVESIISGDLQRRTAAAFIVARDAALRALYKEA